MSCSLNSFKGVKEETIFELIKGDTKNLDYSSCKIDRLRATV